MSLPKVLIADRHPVMLAGLRSLVGSFCEVVGEVNNGRALVMVALSLRPHLIILAIGMPELNGIEAARKIKARWPEARFLFFTAHTDLARLREALAAGGSGLVSKTSDLEELRAGITTVLEGGKYISSALGPDILESLRTPTHNRTHPSVQLSERQREILQLIAEGQSSKEIATVLNISPKTVEFHRTRMMQKLRVHSTAELAVAAVRLGIALEADPLGISTPVCGRKALEGLWRSRLDEIRLRFDHTSRRLVEIQKNLREGLMPSSDGDFAFQKILIAQNQALAEYNRVLRFYYDLIVSGKTPDDIEGPPAFLPNSKTPRGATR